VRPLLWSAGVVGVVLLLAMVPPAAARSGVAASGTAAGSGRALSTHQVIAALAREGVGVYASPTSTSPLRHVTAPVVPIRVLRSQAAADAAGTAPGDGIPGARLDAAVPMPKAAAGKQYPPFSYLLAAYAGKSSTPGEKLAHTLLGSADLTHPDTVLFPSLVLTLLSADAYRAAASGRHHEHAAEAAVAAPPLADVAGAGSGSGSGTTVCSALSDWVSNGLSSLVKALTVGPSSNAAVNFIGGLWNSALALAVGQLPNIVSTLSAPVLGVIRRGFATAALVSWAVSAFRNLKVTTTATPPYNAFGIDPAGDQSGALTIKLGSADGFDFPQGLKDCADLLKITLPSFNEVAGRTVNWNLAQVNGVPTSSWCSTTDCNLATEDTSGTDAKLGAQHTATLKYTTNTEAAAQAAGGLITNDYILVTGTVSLDTQALAKLIRDIVLGDVPGDVRVVAGPLLDTVTSAVVGQIAGLAAPSFSRYVQIEHHSTPCLVGNWTTTSVNDGTGPGVDATWDWEADGTVTVDYDDSLPSPAGWFFRGTEAGDVTLSSSDPSGSSGTLNEDDINDGLTYYVDGQVISPGAAAPESGTWTCSGDQASVTFFKADGPNTWDIQRDAP
jgi:hypothetical protein